MNQKLILRISAIISGLSGLVILAGVLYPIVSYDSKFSANYDSLISPTGKKEAATIEEVDYTRASNWFVGGAAQEDFTSSKVEYYTVSIPKLKIENATVAIGGEDLSKSIIHYPGTALPGKRGNSALFGHSILPIFYNPKDYLSIFSLLPTLKKGDEIFVE